MKRRKFKILIFSTVFAFFLMLGSFIGMVAYAEDTDEIEYSSYLNIAKNAVYDAPITIKTLNNVANQEAYLAPVNAKKYRYMEEKVGDYGFYINGEFYFNEQTTLVENGTYNIRVVSYYFDTDKKCYVPNYKVKLDEFYVVINSKANYITPSQTRFFAKHYISFRELLTDFQISLNLSDEYAMIFSDDIKKWFNNFNSGLDFNGKELNEETNRESIYEVSLNSGQKIDFSLEPEPLPSDTRYSFGIKGGKLSPIVLDINDYDFNLELKDKYITEIVNPLADINLEWLLGERCEVVDVQVIKDYLIKNPKTYGDDEGSISIQIKTNAFKNKPFVFTRRVIIFNSYNNDDIKPVITGEDLVVSSKKELRQKIYDELEFYDVINVNNERIKTKYTLSSEETTFFGLTSNVDEVLATNKCEAQTYKIEYVLQDATGNSTKFSRNITVTDNRPPVILEKYNLLIVEETKLSSLHIDDYYIIIDDNSTEITRTVDVSYDGDITTYTITAKDEAGNTSSKDIKVYVKKNKSFYDAKVMPILWKIKCFFTGEQ